ncbi:hypothetical protein [Geodermatophilus dictyosporus]|uniref:hypothetical protein n=1 Tax=Geodermatophilus dictyosporus TaxID=1523247 RepID=UPI000B85BF9D|nr:hypothetical protein [Geodermatophilus dictyosporus]
MGLPKWMQREPPARTLEEFRARAARSPRPHTLSAGEQFGLVASVLAVAGVIVLLSLIPGLAWLWDYFRLTTPVPLIITAVGFTEWRDRVAHRRRALLDAIGAGPEDAAADPER